jgi:hypothetical protein
MPVAVTNRQDRVAVSPARLARTAGRALAAVGRAAGDVDVLVVDDPAIKRLNRLHRGVDRRTDVLAFPRDTWAEPTRRADRDLGPDGPRQARQVDVSSRPSSTCSSLTACSIWSATTTAISRGAPDARAERQILSAGRRQPRRASAHLLDRHLRRSRDNVAGPRPSSRHPRVKPGLEDLPQNDQPRRVRVAHRSAQRRKVHAPEPDGR